MTKTTIKTTTPKDATIPIMISPVSIDSFIFIRF
jgi:hypothetical protein